MALRRALGLALVVVPPLACSDDGNGQAAGTTGSNSADSASSGDATDQPPICEAYLQCAALNTPNELGGLIESYGPDGSCWGTDPGLAMTCTTACMTGLSDLEDIFGPDACEAANDDGNDVGADGSGEGGGGGDLVIDLGGVPCVQFGVHNLLDFVVGDDTMGITCEITAGMGAGRLPNGLSISTLCEFEGQIDEERVGGWAAIVRVTKSGDEVFVPFCATQSDSDLGYDVVIEPSPIPSVTFSAGDPVSLPDDTPIFEITSGPDGCVGSTCQYAFNFLAAASNFDSHMVTGDMLLDDAAGDPIGVVHGFLATGPAVPAQFQDRPWVLSLEIDYCLTGESGGCAAPAETDDAFAAFAAIMTPG